MQGIGTIYHENQHFQIKIDKTTGDIISAIVIIKNMEKIFKDMSVGLFVGQMVALIILTLIIYFVFRFYKKIINYFSKKS
ncbi:hypothetical protein [Flavobacterium aciduliphilum]|uniref:Uncharacterized protein n=1 Tax=Flavobacterium aciduliphilum TaxID=1101402 RepID=A0A328YJC4_9FLAO|nr:hypothetical protein [Flavobacterium aciduliphilum]RAR74079.1 hypothetical protein CLV55_1026 [Flavobacterium aciduliphilum]